MNNAEIRRRFAQRLIGLNMRVEQISTIDPSEVQPGITYLPIPELGICLVKEYDENWKGLKDAKR